DPKEQLDLGIAAQYAGIPVKELQSYNPAYNQWATAPEGPQKLLIPAEQQEQFLAKVEENRGKGVKLVRYKIQPGDSLGVIAKKHNTTIKVIQNANGMSDSNIRAGRYLLIPTSTQSDSTYAL
ncbi:LysM peptidoglycan-binding domain-containing protein, partial [Vibrio sp. 10N.222.49.C9]